MMIAIEEYLRNHLNCRDVIVAVFWLLANFIALIASWTWSRRLIASDSYFQVMMHTIIVFWGSIVVVAISLGALGILNGYTFLVCILVLSVIALVVHRVWFNDLVESIIVDRNEFFWLVAWTGLLSYWGGVVAVDGLARYPADWDSLAYHLPLVDHWLQSQSLQNTDSCRWAYPGNNELLALWMVAPFSGDFLAALNNLLPTMLFACSTVVFGIRVGLPLSFANLGSLALVSNLVVRRQLIDQENDVAVTACFFAALCYLVRDAKCPNAGDCAFAAISLGLTTGIKYYALGYAVLAFALWVTLTFVNFGVRSCTRVFFAAAIGFIVFGGYWYIRNLLITGSPVYPKEFFTHLDVLHQIYPDVAHTSFFGNNRPELLQLYIEAIWQTMGPFQLIGFLLAPLAFTWLVMSSIWHAFRTCDFGLVQRRAMLAVLLCGTGIILGNTPFAVEDAPGTLNQMHWQYCPVRYGLCYLSVAAFISNLLLRDLVCSFQPKPSGKKTYGLRDRVSTMIRWMTLSSLAGIVFFQLAWAERHFLPSTVQILLMAVNILFLGLIVVMLQVLWPCMRPGLVFLLIAPFAWSIACNHLSNDWHNGFVVYYDSEVFDRELAAVSVNERASKTLCLLDQRCYPFFGSERRRRVCQPVFVSSPEWLMEYLDKERIVYVCAKLPDDSGWRRHLYLNECIARFPNRFRIISEGSAFMTVQVISEPLR